MSQRRRVELTAEQREELRRIAKRDPKPYRRERAVAILKVAGGEVAAQVAAHGLLEPRDPDTVYGWLDRFAERGVAGLTIAPGRGRKPTLFPPHERRAS
jgi:transposase